MNNVLQFLKGIPYYYYIAAAVVITALLVFLIIQGHRKKVFLRLLKEAGISKNSHPLMSRYGYESLCKKSKQIVELSRCQGVNLPEQLGLGEFWIRQFEKSGKKYLQDWILEFIPDQGLFSIFEKALDDKRVADGLIAFIDESRDFLILRRIALSGRGRDFDGNKAMILFQNRMDEIRELTGDPEWAARYLAVKILLHDGEARSDRAVWDSFKDSHGLVRSTVVREIDKDTKPFDTEQKSISGSYLFDILKDLLLNDPVWEVRRAAKERILMDFHSFYTWSEDDLGTEQSLHIVQLLDRNSQEDQDFGMKILESENLELRQNAARFLQDCGVLSRLFRESHLNDKEDLERNYKLLLNATNVNVTLFLQDIEKLDNPGSLLVASRLLKDVGNQWAVNSLASKVFKLDRENKKDPDVIEIYKNTLDCISLHGNDESFHLLEKEAQTVRKDEFLLKTVLERIPSRCHSILLPTLESYLKDPDFSLKDDLRATLLKMPEPDVMEMVLEIIKAGRAEYSHPVRIQALKLLGDLKKEYCLQIILENLSILPLEEGKEFARMLSSYAEDLFNERVESILKSVDAQSRASVIVCLPATGKKTFLKYIQDGLNDANPEVRIACIWALIDYNDTKQLNKSIDMLRDPVESVRIEVAKALGSFGTDSVLKQLEALMNDENEVESVKKAAIVGLSQSENTKSVEILCNKLDQDGELKFECMEGISLKRDKKCLSVLVEQFKDGGPQLRDDISRSVEMMGSDGERLMVELLKEDIPSLHHYIAEVLESSGYVESNIRLLKHRDPKIRKSAADFLSAVRTKAAFRGIVLAARDPNSEVRVSVTKALEALNTEEGKQILQELEQDPDKKVRKYTLWALERVKTKGL